MKFCCVVLVLLLIAIHSVGQSAPAPVYTESFRQGSTHIIEQRFEVKLTPQDSTYRERIKDSRGADRYVFSITPQGPEGDSEVTSWQVKLADLHHVIYDNVLRVSQESSDRKDALWWLDPSKFAQIPVAAKRIIKVENFYVVLQVKAFHFTPPDSPYLDSMTVAVELTNTDPRTAEGTQK